LTDFRRSTEKEYWCCSKADYISAYFNLKPIKAKVCLHCDEAILDCSPFWEWVFWNIVSHYKGCALTLNADEYEEKRGKPKGILHNNSVRVGFSNIKEPGE
jgi:hypothetical protein